MLSAFMRVVRANEIPQRRLKFFEGTVMMMARAMLKVLRTPIVIRVVNDSWRGVRLWSQSEGTAPRKSTVLLRWKGTNVQGIDVIFKRISE
mmetsp:Transcript_9751/g.13602  ORF Transcript_9751/g.13602 Transcript_9751/m.13602 type:complete len:91 (-) Transcript_9751:76-348(-)